MGKVIKVKSHHPLVGKWVTEEEDSSAEFEIKIVQGKFLVTGIDQHDGEDFEITDVIWKDNALHFKSFMPSTGYGAKHVFRTRKDGKVDHELTIYEVWKKRV